VRAGTAREAPLGDAGEAALLGHLVELNPRLIKKYRVSNMKREIILDRKHINDQSDCYVIAEIGHNHQGSLEQCKRLFRRAKDCGADAVKLQKRDNKSLYSKSKYNQPYDNPNSFGATYGEHREFLEFGEEEYLELKEYAQHLEVTFFATPFDFHSADFLEGLDLPLYKMASGDLKNIPLIKHVASFGKPVIISTGGGSIEDVRRIYNEIMPINDQLAILQCTSAYPAQPDQLNLRVIEAYRKMFPDIVIGYSGHDNGIVMPVVAYMLGARIVEKHFTLDRTMKGTDHAFSLSPTGLEHMVRDLHRARQALGIDEKKTIEAELAPLVKMGKKLVAARALPEGHRLMVDDIAIKSPGDGLPPYELDNILGKKLLRSVEEEDDILFELVSDNQ